MATSASRPYCSATAEQIRMFKDSRERAEATQAVVAASSGVGTSRPQQRRRLNPAAATAAAAPPPRTPPPPPPPPSEQAPLRDVDQLFSREWKKRGEIAALFLEQLRQACAHDIACGRVVGPPGSSLIAAPFDKVSTWQQRIVSRVETLSVPSSHCGTWNNVFEISKETIAHAGLPPCCMVLRYTKPGMSVTYADALGELALTLFAAARGFGMGVHAGGLVLSEYQDLAREEVHWRMLLAMQRGTSSVAAMGLNTAPRFVVERMVHRLYDATAELSGHGFVNVDLKLGNLLQREDADEVYIIDWDPNFAFQVLTMHPKAVFLVNLVMLAAQMRVSLHGREALRWIVNALQLPLLELWRQAKNDEFAGAAALRSLRMPWRRKESRFRRLKDPEVSGEERLRQTFPAVCFDYFFDAERGDRNALYGVQWKHWKFPVRSNWGNTTHFPLLPQLLRFGLFADVEVPPSAAALLAVEPES